jgi:4-oxalocrotonate tautomerase
LGAEPEGKAMPHVIVKLAPGKTEEQKAQLSVDITRDIMRVLGYDADEVSVALEEVSLRDWAEKVYRPYILQRPEIIYKQPGYTM